MDTSVVKLQTTTVKPLLTATSDERPPCLLWTFTSVLTASVFSVVLTKLLLCGLLSTPYYGHTFISKVTLSGTNRPLYYGQPHPLSTCCSSSMQLHWEGSMRVY